MLVIGSIFVDVKGFAQGNYLPEGTNIGDVQVTPGGVCRNVAEDLAHLGIKSTFVSLVDETALGRDVRESLTAIGVDTSHIIDAPRGMGMWLAILDENGDLRGSISRQPEQQALEKHIEEAGDALVAQSRGVVLCFDTNAAITSKVLELAEKHGKPVYGLVGNMGLLMRHPEYLKKTACFICNEHEAERLFDRPVQELRPEEMLPMLVQESRNAGIPAMVITMGPLGSVYVDHRTGEFGRCPAQSVNMVDSTGAGDAFFTGTVAAITRGIPLSQAVRAGTALAARTLQVAGACCPDTGEIIETMGQGN